MKKVDALGKYTNICHTSLLEDGSGCSKKQIPVSSSSLELCSSCYAPLNPKCTQRVHHLRYIHLQLAHCHGSDSDPGEASSAEASFATNIANQSALWKFLYTGILFQVWDTMCCACFCKKQAVVQHVISCAQH